jgi:hypothetical protein
MKRLVICLAPLLACCAIGLVAPSAAFAQVRIEMEAFAGQPFGVGRVVLHSGGDFRINLPQRPGRGRIADLAKRLAGQAGKGDSAQLQSGELAIVERSGRVFFPVFAKRQRPVLEQFISVPSESAVYFLFQGDAPLDMTVFAPDAVGSQVAVRVDPAGHARLLAAWWRDFSAAAEGRDASRDYPQMVEEYLTGTLARRMRLELPRRTPERQLNLLRGELSLLAGAESARLEAAEVILRGGTPEAASVLLPEELPTPQPEALDPPADVPVEPIAMRVPVECLYVRFGSFPNFIWLRHRLEDWGGELRDVISERGLDYGLNARFQKQLGLRESALAEVLGDKVIADVALIGTDAFMNEGAAIGTLFHAKSNVALSADLNQQRTAAMREAKGGKQEKLTIAGRQVSYISTPDGTLRSYYVVDGDFHLVTTSRQIVEWFLATADGKHPSLGASDKFRYTRARLPLDRSDTVFVYLSPEFFENLLGAHYHIEMQRRLRSDVEMELVPIAQLAAKAEGKPATSIDELIAADMLPQGFGQRSDGSRLVLEDGRLIDTLRGARGTFVPVPDMPIDKVTPAEAAEYREFQDYYVQQWGRMEPVAVAIRREALPEGKLERVVLDVQAAPLAPQHVAMLSNWLGEPTTQRLAPVAGDVASFEAVLSGGGLLGGGSGEHHLFGALRNADPAVALSADTSLIARIMQSQLQGLQGYFGAWPEPGFTSMLGGASDLPPDAAGYTRLRTGLWRRQLDAFTLLSFNPEILEQASSQLQFMQAQRPAQVWLHTEDLANSTLAPLINSYGYKQSRLITAGNTRFLNLLVEQLHVPPAEALTTAERLLNAKFVAPLGGGYELRKSDNGEHWVATALVDKPAGNAPPADYQFPALNWLRGVDLELSLQKAPEAALAAHAEFIMPVETRAPAFQLPKLPFGLSTPATSAPTKSKPPPAAPSKPPTPNPPQPSKKREF